VDLDNTKSYSSVVYVKYRSDIELKIHPNPAHRKLSVTFSQIIENATFRTIDKKGSYMPIEVRKVGQKSYELDVSGLSSGPYFIEIHTEKGKYIRKVVKNDR
jgi:mRNA-degrading endonuclease HigB of HigAB toxin-antitoxin module